MIRAGAAATLGCASAVAALEVPDCEIHFIVAAWVEIKHSASGVPDNSPLSHFSATTRPSWLGRAARDRHRHAIEQASRHRERAVKFDFRTGRRL